MKRLFIIIMLLFTLAACGKNDYIPTALITNLSYDSTLEVLGFQVEITDKSSTIDDAVIQLYSNGVVDEIKYIKNHSLYSFENVEKNQEYTIKIQATYEMNATLLENKELYSLDITNYISTKEIYFLSRTFAYTGEEYSIYLTNVDESYTVKYENNKQSEVGVYEVKAQLYLNDELIETYIAYIVITEEQAEISAVDQKHYYTSNPINVDYQISNNAKTKITYNDSLTAPTNVGEYNVIIEVLGESNKTISKVNVIMEILRTDVTIYSSNKVVISNGNQQRIEFSANIECDSIITYNNSTAEPTTPGMYEVIIKINETSNHKGTTKHLTLTILDENEINDVKEIFISQIVYTNDYDVIIELYNPTQTSINLNGYKILIGDESHNKFIVLQGTITSLSTYTIASTNTVHELTFDAKSEFLVVNSNEKISLYKNEIIDEVILNDSINYIRKSFVGFPKSTFVDNEWEYLTNDIALTINSHEYNYSATNITSSYEVSYKNINYINYQENVNFSNHIIVTLSNETITITNDMIIENNININQFGQYNVTFKIGTFEFTTIFEVTDLSGPIIKVNNISLTFSINESIDYLSLVTVTDYSNSVDVEFSVDTLQIGVNEVTYKATDEYGNVSTLSIYIFIVQ